MYIALYLLLFMFTAKSMTLNVSGFACFSALSISLTIKKKEGKKENETFRIDFGSVLISTNAEKIDLVDKI